MYKRQIKIIFSFILFIALASAACEGPEGPQGPRGEQGPPGPVGPAGTDGSMIHAGEGAPEAGLGNPGDFYLDLATGQLYGPQMTEGWGEPVGLGGSQGPQGPPGEDGSQIFAGSGPPDDDTGRNGDYYLDRDNYELYGPKTGDGWGTPINLQGPGGEQGPEGPAGTTNHSALDNLDSDDHLQYLLVNGVRDATNGFAITGTPESGLIPVEGEGARLVWYPGKAAFRAGFVNGDQWDDDNIGFASTAMGFGTVASGNSSTAMGWITTASDYSSTAMGNNSTASGEGSTAMGWGTTASGNYSTAMGWGTTASGNYSTAMGAGTIAASDYSLSIGGYNTANTTSDNTLFVAGNGTGQGDESDALRLDTDGNLWIAGNLTEASDQRLKTDIELLKTDVLDRLGHIRPVRYRFKEGAGHPTEEQIGLIAQEVQAQFPELVTKKNDNTLGLSYTKFTAVLLKGMQEQQAEIERLRAEVRRIDRLEKQISELKTGSSTNGLPMQLSGVGLILLTGIGGILFRKRRSEFIPEKAESQKQR